MTLLFLKRLNDTFEENAEKLTQEGKSKKEAYSNKNRHSFFVPDEARWSQGLMIYFPFSFFNAG
jgi:type I restriction-modification system DNA methylase subunit